MNNFLKLSKTCLLALLSVLFLSVGIKAEAAPGTVTGVKQIDFDTSYGSPTDSVALQWSTTGNPIKYRVEYCDNTDFTGSSYRVGTTSSASNTVIIHNLAAGKSYYVRITAIDGAQTLGLPSTPIEVVTAPSGKVGNIKQNKVSSNRVSFSWKEVPGANIYDVRYRKSDSQKITSKQTKKALYSFKASADNKYLVGIFPARKSSSNYIAINEAYTPTYMPTSPKKITKLKMVSSGNGSSRTAGIATFTWKESKAADGYDYEICGNNNKRILKGSVKGYPYNQENGGIDIKSGKLKNDQFMKIRVKPYLKVNGKKVSTNKWSDYLWFAKTPQKVKAAVSPSQRVEDGIVISWSKITGATDYSVYISKSFNSGYQKVATTADTSYNLRSLNGFQLAGGTYYYHVVANKKVKGKTYKSDPTWHFRISLKIVYTS